MQLENMHDYSFVYPGRIHNEKYAKMRDFIRSMNINEMSNCKYNIKDKVMQDYNGKGNDCKIVKKYLEYLYYEHPNNLSIEIFPHKDKTVDVTVEHVDKHTITRAILNFMYKL